MSRGYLHRHKMAGDKIRTIQPYMVELISLTIQAVYISCLLDFEVFVRLFDIKNLATRTISYILRTGTSSAKFESSKDCNSSISKSLLSTTSIIQYQHPPSQIKQRMQGQVHPEFIPHHRITGPRTYSLDPPQPTEYSKWGDIMHFVR